MTLTFVLRLRTAPTGESPATIAGRVEIVQRGTEYIVHSLAELEAVLVQELALADRVGEGDGTPIGNGNGNGTLNGTLNGTFNPNSNSKSTDYGNGKDVTT